MNRQFGNFKISGYLRTFLVSLITLKSPFNTKKSY